MEKAGGKRADQARRLEEKRLLRKLEAENGYRLTHRFWKQSCATAREHAKLRKIVVPADATCHICEAKAQLFRDHRHGTTVLRGFLCRRCNLGLGMFRDDPGLLTVAARYVGEPA